MPRRIRADFAWREMRHAEVRKARRDYLCDYGCSSNEEDTRIPKGTEYAYINTGLKVCNAHYSPSDVEETP